MPSKYDGKTMAEAVANFINTYGDHAVITEFVNRMASEHRTLQQGFTRLCWAWFTHLASLTEYQYDPRNEASVQLAKEIVALKGKDVYLPLI